MSLEERVARLEAWRRRSRLLSLVKYAAYAVIIAGVVVYLYGLYSSMDEWRLEMADRPRLGLRSPTQLQVDLYVRIYNPDGDVDARLVYYRVFIEGYYAGDGFIPYLHLPGGWSEHKVSAVIDLSRASCGVAEAFLSEGNIRVRVEGYAMVDLKAFGVVPWKTVTVPFNVTAAEVAAPPLDPTTKALLQLYLLACKEPEKLNALIEAASRLANLPNPFEGIGGAVGNLTPPPLDVEARVEPAGLAGYRVVVEIRNTGSEPVTILHVFAGAKDLVSEPITLNPGGSVRLEAPTLTSATMVTVIADGYAPMVLVARAP